MAGERPSERCDLVSRPSRSAAIIGAGPSGLAAARFLRRVGFRVTLFDRSDGVGGQWRADAVSSGIWPGMRTNTSRINTAFSDLPHSSDAATYPTAEEMGAYLARYAAQFDLLEGARFRSTVTEVEPEAGQWRVSWRDTTGHSHDDHYSHVVVATGRHHRPIVPPVPGLDAFTGSEGVSHAASYRGSERFRGKRVLVAGHGISALEIASEIAIGGAARVVIAARRHRYVLPRLIDGVPMDHRVYTRAAGLAWETLPIERSSAALKELVLASSGHPSASGAPVHSEDVLTAGFTHSPHYLRLVASGQIVPMPWMGRVEGDTVVMQDGRTEVVDAIVCCTGYALDLPFLGPTVRRALDPDLLDADLHEHTFHPDLPGFACLGLYEQGGPYLPTLELQARWVAYVWGGECAALAEAELAEGVRQARARRGTGHVERAHLIARRFARLAGVEPAPWQWPDLARALYFGPLSPASFRLSGPDAMAEAPARVVADAAAFGCVEGATLSAAEWARLRELAGTGPETEASAAFAGWLEGLMAALRA